MFSSAVGEDHSSDRGLFTKIKVLLQAYVVVLLLPSPDQDESLRIAEGAAVPL
jgi:hypothetical protein